MTDPTLSILHLLCQVTLRASRPCCSPLGFYAHVFSCPPQIPDLFPPSLMASFQLPGLNTHSLPHQHTYINQKPRPAHRRGHVVFVFLCLGFLPTLLKRWRPVVRVLKFPEATHAMLLFPSYTSMSFFLCGPSSFLYHPFHAPSRMRRYRQVPWHLFLFLCFQLSIDYWKSIMNQNVSWISWYYSLLVDVCSGLCGHCSGETCALSCMVWSWKPDWGSYIYTNKKLVVGRLCSSWKKTPTMQPKNSAPLLYPLQGGGVQAGVHGRSL